MNRRHIHTAATAAAILFFAGATSVGVAQSTVPAAVVHDGAYWKAIEDRLGDEDPKVRSAAQKELEQIPLSDRGTLVQRRDACTDDEVKARLNARIEEMDVQVATDPPPISIELKDATLSDVVNALHAATGASMTSWPPYNDSRHLAFTLSATNKPFWEIFTQLSAIHSLTIQRSDRLQIMQQEPGLLHGIPAAHGFSFFPGTIVRSKTTDLQAVHGKEIGDEQLSFSYTLAADPRMKVLSHSAPILTEVSDDAGNDLLGPLQADYGVRGMQQNQQAETLFQGNAQLVIPQNMGKKLASVKGHARFVIQVSEERLDVADPQATLNKPLTIGTSTVTIGKFQPHDGTIEFSLTSTDSRRPRGGNQPSIRLEFLDGANLVFWESRLWGGSGGSVGTGDAKPPFKIRLSAANKTKELQIDFQATNISLP